MPRILLLALLALLLTAPAAQACTDQPLSRPFTPWLDYAHYTPAPDGGLEAAGDGWTLTGGAAAVDGGQPWGGGSRSLSLPDGASATTAPVCITIAHPTVRFFVRGTGPLTVSVLAGGVELPIGTLRGGAAWAPSAMLPVVVNLLGVQEVRFKLASEGPLRVDDFLVDPYSKG